MDKYGSSTHNNFKHVHSYLQDQKIEEYLNCDTMLCEILWNEK